MTEERFPVEIEHPVMKYNKKQKRPYKNCRVQWYKPWEDYWQTYHTAHRPWSKIDINDQLKLIQYNFSHLKKVEDFRIIDENDKIIATNGKDGIKIKG